MQVASGIFLSASQRLPPPKMKKVVQGVVPIKAGKLDLLDAPAVQQVAEVTPESTIYDQNVFAIFEAESVWRVARLVAQKLMHSVGLRADPNVLVSLRASIGEEDALDVTLPICGGQFAQLPNDNSAVVLANFVIEPSLDGARAHRIRSLELLYGGSARHAMANVAAAGKIEAGDIVNSEVKEPQARLTLSLLGVNFAMPQLVVARFERRAPLTFSMLLRERTEEVAAAKPPVAAAAAAAAEQPPPPPVLTVQQAWLRARNARLAELLAEDALQIKCIVTGPLTKQQLLDNGSFISLPFSPAERPLDKITWERAIARVGARGEPPATWPYFLATPPFLIAPPAGAPVSVTEPVRVSSAAVSSSTSTAATLFGATQAAATTAVAVPLYESAAEVDVVEPEAPPRVEAYEPLLYFARRIPLAQLTIYEVETYARARLHWHVLRLSDYERAGKEDDDAWFERVTAANRERYPEKSGAMRSLLLMLGSAAAMREQHHEAIGLGILALVAEPSEALRDNLLFLEALAIEASAHGDREAIDAAVFARLELLERFWNLCGPVVYAKNSASVLERVLAGIAADWQSGLVRMNS